MPRRRRAEPGFDRNGVRLLDPPKQENALPKNCVNHAWQRIGSKTMGDASWDYMTWVTVTDYRCVRCGRTVTETSEY